MKFDTDMPHVVLYNSKNTTRALPWRFGGDDGYSWFVEDDDGQLVATCANSGVQHSIVRNANREHFIKCKGVSKRGRILRLTLKKEWFDLISTGIKTEECREIKPWSTSRLMDKHPLEGYGLGKFEYTFKHYDYVKFKNGYQKDAPVIVMECNYICRCAKSLHPTWGEPNAPHYVIGLGQKIYG